MMSRTRLGAVLVMVVIGLGVVWAATRPKTAPPTPRTSGSRADTDRPEDQYVGTQSCATCHPLNAALHADSGHAHTFQLTKNSEIARQLDGQTFEDPERGTTFHYEFDDEGLFVTIPEQFGESRFPLTYALGSGTHGVTFLSLIPHEDGQTVGVEHRATFYRELQGLGITLGQETLPPPGQDVENFGKLIAGHDLQRCVECHTTTARIEHQRIVNLRPGVGCESCHGPGKRHVQAVKDGAADLAIRRVTSAESEIRLCGRCHRLPEMLNQTKLSRESKALVRLQPVGLLQSPCYRKSEGALRCTTCHDPHQQPSTDHRHYERICLDCHTAPKSTACPVNPQTNCVQCHMPGIKLKESIFHDHWIRVRNASDPVAVP